MDKVAQLKFLLVMAASDGGLAREELLMLTDRARQFGMELDEFEQVVNEVTGGEVELTFPESKEDRMTLLTDVIRMMGADGELHDLAQELNAPQMSAWQFAQASADWVRKNVEYRLGSYRGAKFAHEQRIGDCEDLSALMIALCRISDIPARTVWVEGHAYPEIHLEAPRRLLM